MINYVDGLLTSGGISEDFMMRGACDIWVFNLTAGSVKLQVKFKNTSWMDAPDGSFTEDTMRTIGLSEDQVLFRLVGVGNNTDVYFRLAR